MKIYLTIALITCCFFNVYAQPNSDTSTKANINYIPKTDIFTDFVYHPSYETQESYETNALISALSLNDLNSALLKEQMDYAIYVYKYQERVFDWEYTSSLIIFWMVIFIVFVGIVFSGVQFHYALQHEKHVVNRIRRAGNSQSKNLEQPELADGGSHDATEFEASLKGIKVKSPIVGIIILSISIVFFYLYLAYVYPVTVVDGTHTTPSQSTSNVKP